MDSKGREKKVSLHIKSQARDFLYSGHGYHTDGRIWQTGNSWTFPEEISQEDWNDNLNTVIFNCCSVLDIGDFNGHYIHSDAHKENPGLKWFSRIKDSPHNICLLGHNYEAPSAPYDESVIKMFFLDLREGLKSIESSGRTEPVAWVKASAEASDYDTACAITKEYYYFIYYNPILRENDRKWWHIYRRIYAIKRSVWDRPEGAPLDIGDVPFNDMIELKYELPDIPSVIY